MKDPRTVDCGLTWAAARIKRSCRPANPGFILASPVIAQKMPDKRQGHSTHLSTTSKLSASEWSFKPHLRNTVTKVRRTAATAPGSDTTFPSAASAEAMMRPGSWPSHDAGRNIGDCTLCVKVHNAAQQYYDSRMGPADDGEGHKACGRKVGDVEDGILDQAGCDYMAVLSSRPSVELGTDYTQ